MFKLCNRIFTSTFAISQYTNGYKHNSTRKHSLLVKPGGKFSQNHLARKGYTENPVPRFTVK